MSKSLRTILLAVVIVAIVGAIYVLERPQRVEMESGEMMVMGPVGEVSAIEVGAMAPDFRLLDYEHNIHQLSDYYGRPIVVNFWASWCPFCINEMPDFQEVYEKLGSSDTFAIVAVNRAEQQETAQAFTDPMNLSFTLLLDPTESVASAYKILAMPSTYFIDEAGVLVDIHRGPLTAEQFEDKLAALFGLGTADEVVAAEEAVTTEEAEQKSEREINVTDGIKHSVPLEDIVSGGPDKDGIPPIDDPKFVSVEAADDFLEDDLLGIGVSFDGIDRFYSFQILNWHEIVNDVVGTQPALITYCPLCGTGIVFEPIVNGAVTEFGTSGKLWNSNLVMYDRQTDSYWSQALGEAIVGEMTGTRLSLLPHDNILWGDWKKIHPEGEVLSTDTGYFRDYSRNPYPGYDTSEDVWFDLDNEDDRYHPKEPMWGIEVNGFYKAYVLEELEKTPASFRDKVGGVEIEVGFDTKTNTIQFTRSDTGEEIIPFYSFWFSWVAVHPTTDVYIP